MPTNVGHCRFAGCATKVAASLDGQMFCRNHFISVCQARLEKYERLQKSHSITTADTETLRQFITECVKNIDQIERAEANLTDADRKSLLDISVWTNELGRQIRRSPRKAASIVVRLSGESPEGTWEEEAKTVLLSQYGASLISRRTLKPGDIVQIERTDSGDKAHARVAWHIPLGEEGVRFGAEFMGCENFWGLDWSEVMQAK